MPPRARCGHSTGTWRRWLGRCRISVSWSARHWAALLPSKTLSLLPVPTDGRRLSTVPTIETAALLRRARDLAERASRPDPARAQFIRELNRLHRIAGKPPIVEERVVFQDAVANVLRRVPNVVVASRPLATGGSGRPDFLVTGADRAVVVSVLESPLSPRRLRRCVKRLLPLLRDFRAAEGFVVVPNPAPTRLGARDVHVVELSQLASAVDQALRR